MHWLRKLFKTPHSELEVSWHVERVHGHWDKGARQWDDAHSPKYLSVFCYANKAHAEESSSWDSLSIDCASSTVTGPHYHAAGTCREQCMAQERQFKMANEEADADRRSARIAELRAGDWVDELAGRRT